MGSTHQRFKDIEDDFKLVVGDDSGCQLIVDDNNYRYSNFLVSPP